MIDRGANVNARDAVADFTPLHWAAGNETLRPHLVKLLLGKRRRSECGGRRTRGRARTGAADPAVDRRKARPDGDRRRARRPPEPGISLSPKKSPRRNALFRERLDHSTIIASAEKALAALQTTAARSREAFVRHVSKQDCVSCHQQYLPMAAVGHARNRSIRFDHEAAREQIDLARQPQESVLPARVRGPGRRSSGAGSLPWLPVAWSRRRRGSAERHDRWTGPSPGDDPGVGRPLEEQPAAAPDDVERCHCDGVVDPCHQVLRLAGPPGGVRGQHRARPPVAVVGQSGNE